MKNKKMAASLPGTSGGRKRSGGVALESRRTFLKKAAYTAPVLIALGQLAYPDQAEAESCIPCPPWETDPDCCGNQ